MLYSGEYLGNGILLDKEAANEDGQVTLLFWLLAAIFMAAGEQTNNVGLLLPVLIELELWTIKDRCDNGLSLLADAGDPKPGWAFAVICVLNIFCGCCGCNEPVRWFGIEALLTLLVIIGLISNSSLKSQNECYYT